MKNKNRLTWMIATALLMALIILFGLTPIGFINVGVVYITFLCIPVLIGTLALGLESGLILALCMGSVSLYTGLRAPSALVAPIMQKNLIWVILLCYVPRLLVPLVAAAVKKLLQGRNEKLVTPLAAGLGSLTNTVFYLGLMLAFYWLLGIDNPALLGTIGTITLTAGLPEAAAAAIIATPVMAALMRAGLIKKNKAKAKIS